MISGIIFPLASDHSMLPAPEERPLSRHSVTTDKIFCTKIDGIALTIAEKTMQNAVNGNSLG